MRSFCGVLLFSLFSLLPMIIAAAITVGIVLAAGQILHLPWFLLAVASPLLYVCWLVSYLYLSGWTCERLGNKYPKPRYQTYGRDRPIGDVGMMTVAMCYNRLNILDTLPLAWTMARTNSFKTLVLRAYSPSVHLGKNSVNWGDILDPDLTRVGEDVVIGAHAVISAHGDSLRPNGDHVYVSAPIQIGHRVTIGGGSRVTLGCVIGDDAVVEQGAVLPPFTIVPQRGVWAGNPARPQRTRENHFEGPAAATATTVVTNNIAALVENALGIVTDLPWVLVLFSPTTSTGTIIWRHLPCAQEDRSRR